MLRGEVRPGAGQAYSGDYGEGLKALRINAVFGIPFGRSVLDGRLLDGLSVFSYLQRFYSGNRANSVKAAETHNDRLNRRHAERVLEALAKAAKAAE